MEKNENNMFFLVEVLNIYNFSIVVFMAHGKNSSRLGGSLQFQRWYLTATTLLKNCIKNLSSL